MCGVFVMCLGAKSNAIISFNLQCHLKLSTKSFLINFLLHKRSLKFTANCSAKICCVFPRRWNFLFISSWHVSTNTMKNPISCRERREKTMFKPPEEGWVKVFFTSSRIKLFLTIFKSSLNLTCYPPLRLSFMLVSFDIFS